MWLTHARIWDGVSEAVRPEDALLIEANRIVRLGHSSEASGEVHDCEGQTLIPGLIDAHVHMCLDPDIRDPLEQDKFSDDDIRQRIRTHAQNMLAAGITTARDLGGGNWLELEVRDEINRGDFQGTRLLCAGQPVTSVKGHCYFWGGEADDLSGAIEVIERQMARQVDLIKIMATGGSLTPASLPKDSQFSRDDMIEMVGLAKRNNYRVAAHCHGTEGIGHAAAAGVTSIEHCSWVGNEGWAKDFSADIARQIAENDVWVSPTINAGWARYQGTKSFETLICANYEAMKAAGIKLIASTDAGIPGVLHADLPKALPVFAHFAGLSAVATLRAATSDCADALGLAHTVGQLAAGFEADIVAFDGDPLTNLEVLSQPKWVMSRGNFVGSASRHVSN